MYNLNFYYPGRIKHKQPLITKLRIKRTFWGKPGPNTLRDISRASSRTRGRTRRTIPNRDKSREPSKDLRSGSGGRLSSRRNLAILKTEPEPDGNETEAEGLRSMPRRAERGSSSEMRSRSTLNRRPGLRTAVPDENVVSRICYRVESRAILCFLTYISYSHTMPRLLAEIPEHRN